MKDLLFVLILTILIEGTAQGGPTPDTGASGDMRRNLATALNDMGAVDIPVAGSGAYKGLYQVECFFSEGNWRLCRAATAVTGSQTIANTSSAALVMGQVFVANVQGASGAVRIRANLVACNSVGDHCTIEGITLD